MRKKPKISLHGSRRLAPVGEISGQTSRTR